MTCSWLSDEDFFLSKFILKYISRKKIKTSNNECHLSARVLLYYLHLGKNENVDKDFLRTFIIKRRKQRKRRLFFLQKILFSILSPYFLNYKVISRILICLWFKISSFIFNFAENNKRYFHYRIICYETWLEIEFTYSFLFYFS